ncbi:hypothetical protein PH5382_01268 [Phaeobacter sp. CECT 5382]|nr:hypothetical protein PH5382_01268 [Phaeobacter sp. CECT 5382]
MRSVSFAVAHILSGYFLQGLEEIEAVSLTNLFDLFNAPFKLVRVLFNS